MIHFRSKLFISRTPLRYIAWIAATVCVWQCALYAQNPWSPGPMRIENVRDALIAKKQPYYEDTPGTPIGLPRITFSDAFSVHLGGKEVRALYFGRDHTDGDAVIYFPEEKAIQTGDLFLARTGAYAQKLFIFIDYAHGGSLFEWTRTLDRILALDFDKVIPGHGPVSTKADVAKFRSDLEAMRTRLIGLIKQGKSKDDIANTLESDYGWKSKGCPPSPPTGGCLSIQQLDSLIEELKRSPKSSKILFVKA